MPQAFDTVHNQVQNYLRECIRSGTYKPGDRLPSERDLARSLDVSRGSVRIALRSLEQEGMLQRVERVGYFVGPSKLVYEPGRLATFTGTIRGEGYRPGARVLQVREELPGREIREYLRLPVGKTIYFIQRLRLASGRPAIIETVYLPSDLCPGIISIDLNDRSLWGLMTGEYGIELGRAEIHLSLMTLNAEQARLLEVPAGSPAFLLTRLTFNRQDVPIEFDHEIYRGDISEFHIQAVAGHGVGGLNNGHTHS